MRKAFCGAVAAFLLGGCSQLSYYAQAVDGHFELMGAARPIQTVLSDPATPPELKRRLERVDAIRDFASRELALPDNGSYRSYADIVRPFAVWNVFAAAEFSVRPERWCVWPVGCVAYRGYFDRGAAERLAAGLRQNGFDVYVAGVPTYSTLGFFDDPVLNTFLRFGETEVARLIFHELAHHRVFVAGDTAFNESFATAVENEGMRRWFARNANPAQIEVFAAQQARKAQFVELIAAYRDKLRAVYAAASPPETKRRAKEETFVGMRNAYADLKASWGGYAGYDKWFEADLNNAKLASLSLYLQFVPAFEALLAAEDHDLPRFFQRVEALAERPPAERSAALNAYLPPERKLALTVREASPAQ